MKARAFAHIKGEKHVFYCVLMHLLSLIIASYCYERSVINMTEMYYRGI